VSARHLGRRLVLARELDERLGLEAILTEHLRDFRHRLNTDPCYLIYCGNRSTAAWRATRTSTMKRVSQPIQRVA
jgi:hypothetical protein